MEKMVSRLALSLFSNASQFSLVAFLFSGILYAAPGLLFQVSPSGAKTSSAIDIILCLNGKGPLSCQHYYLPVGTTTLNIKSTKSRNYPIAGIKVVTKGYSLNTSTCTMYPKTGYCIFGLSAGVSTRISFTLTLSPATLALSVHDTGINSALTGSARTITLSNATSDAVVLDSDPTTWTLTPAINGTQITGTSCTGNTIPANGSCTITVTPGSTVSSDASSSLCTTGVAPAPSTYAMQSGGATIGLIQVVVLGYGCQYQGGFVYSVDDTSSNGVSGQCTSPPCTGSIGGKVVSTIDQAAPYTIVAQLTSIVWSSNGTGGAFGDGTNCSSAIDGFCDGYVSYDTLPGISNTSSTSSEHPSYSTFVTFWGDTYTISAPPQSFFSPCNGATDGQCNSTQILTFYNQYITNYNASGSPLFTPTAGSPTPLGDYAAGLCSGTIAGYADWYLPAICEMDAVNSGASCPSGMQSMFGSLSFLIGNPSSTTPAPSASCNTLNGGPPSGTECLAGYYWSSTEYSSLPQAGAWNEYFASDGGNQYGNYKNSVNGVRCSRAFNP